MYMISSREDFWDGKELSNEDQIKEVVLDDPDPGVDKSVDNNTFFDMVKDKKLLLLIHGFNNEADDVCRAYAIIENNISRYLKDHYNYVVGYTWPGGDDPLDYFKAKRRASAVAPRVVRWLAPLTKVAQSIDVMNHSMGARVILSALRSTTKIKMRNFYNMASAVEDESVQHPKEYFPATKLCEGMYVFHSRND